MEKIQERILLTSSFDIHQDWEVPIPGFFIVAARDASKRSIADFSDDEAGELIRAIKQVRVAMRETLNVEDVYLFQNEDTSHGFHVWVFPRYEWMEPFGRKIESVRPIMVHAQKTMDTEENSALVREAAERMRTALAS